MAKFHKDRTVQIIVLIKKVYNYILRAKVIELIELKVKGEPVVYNKANKVDLLLNNLLIYNINNTKVIIKKEP